MARQVLEIVNEAQNLIKDAALYVASDFDSGTQSDQREVKTIFNTAYKYLVSKQHEDFRYEYDLTTVNGQKIYSLPTTLYLTNTDQVRLISSTLGESYYLQYLTEEEAENLAPNPAVDINTTGKPFYWFLNTTSTAGTKELRFMPTSDAAYTIRFYLQTVPTALTANQLTACNERGDEWLKLELAWRLLFSRGFAQYEMYKIDAENAWKDYVGTTLKNQVISEYRAPDFLEAV